MGAHRQDSLFFAGDTGQRIFQQPFSWKALGIDIRGRSKTLQINYRTSHQIRMQADLLLDPELSDVDGNKEKRNKTISIFNGPKPGIMVLKTQKDEIQTVGKWIAEQTGKGLMPHEIGLFVRSRKELSTMHLAKGLEFKAVIVMACDDEVIPLQKRIENAADETDLEDVYNTERHLLYVACTRARDYLLITAADPCSEFLEDMQIEPVFPNRNI